MVLVDDDEEEEEEEEEDKEEAQGDVCPVMTAPPPTTQEALKALTFLIPSAASVFGYERQSVLIAFWMQFVAVKTAEQSPVAPRAITSVFNMYFVSPFEFLVTS